MKANGDWDDIRCSLTAVSQEELGTEKETQNRNTTKGVDARNSYAGPAGEVYINWKTRKGDISAGSRFCSSQMHRKAEADDAANTTNTTGTRRRMNKRQRRTFSPTRI